MIRVKTPAELEKMKKACRVSAGALAAAGKAIRPGVSTAEVDAVVYQYITSHGGTPNFLNYNGFPGSACISIGDTVIHGIPTRGTIIREGDIVSVDTGAIVDGFHGDNAYTYPCGEISAEAERLLRITRESCLRGIAAAAPGKRIGDIGHAVQQYVEEAGYGVVTAYVGHGVGFELHESPEVPNHGRPGHGARIIPGMTLAIEPMINQGTGEVDTLSDGWTVKTRDGGLSAHFEHTVAVTPEGPVILTEWEFDPWKS